MLDLLLVKNKFLTYSYYLLLSKLNFMNIMIKIYLLGDIVTLVIVIPIVIVISK